MYCNQCGAQITDGNAFCPKCGAKQNGQKGEDAAVQPLQDATPRRKMSTEYCEYEALEFSGIEAMYYDGSRWIVSLEKTEYTYF